MATMKDAIEAAELWQPWMPKPGEWQAMVEGIEPKEGGCGLVYEVPNPFDRPGESFAIADMRQLDLSEPHRHLNGEIEIYFVIEGTGRMAVGDEVRDIGPGNIIITPSGVTHITKPLGGLVLGVVNLPPFNLDNYEPVAPDDPQVLAVLPQLKAH